MQKKGLIKIVIGITLVTALVVGLSLIGCAPTAAPPEAPPEAPPPEGEVITAKIGTCSALSGPVAGWVLPGFNGTKIWADHINAAGGIELSDGTRVMIEIIGYDTEYNGEKAAAGARKLAEVDKVVLVNQLGGGPDMPAVPILTENKIISTTSLSCDLNPDAPYHCCPDEWWPMDMPLAADLFFREHPEVKTLAYICQNDEIGINCLANFAAVARIYNVELIHEKLFDMETVDFAPIVSDAIASGADAITLGSAYPDFTTLMCEQVYLQGWDGPMFGSVLDFYDAIAERTSYEFLEGYIFAYPDWDDPALNPSPNPYCTIQPKDFWEENNAKYPGTWTANTWEHLGRLEVWKQGVMLADSIEPMKVWEAWKTAPELYHVYGQGKWGGKELYGVDNCLFAPWPIVELKGGHARTVEMVNPTDWLATGQNLDILIEELEEYDLMWYQLLGLTRAEAMAQYPESF